MPLTVPPLTMLKPGWLASDEAKLEGKVERMPFPEDVRLPFDVAYSLVI